MSLRWNSPTFRCFIYCLVLEDSVNGVISAKAAGMLVYGVNADKKIRAELKKAGADEVYSSLKELTGKFST